MTTITLPKFEYRELKKKASAYEAMVLVPEYYLKGKAAKQLDRRVAQALKEYKAGKTKPFKFS